MRHHLLCLFALPAAMAGAADPLPADNDGGSAITVYSAADPAQFDPEQFLEQARRETYNSQPVPGFGVVRELRDLELKQGENTVDLTDVAKRIDPATVSLEDVADAKAVKVLEQRFLFDLVSPQKLLDRYIGQRISVSLTGDDQATHQVECTLLANDYNQLVLQTEHGIRLATSNSDVQLGKLPSGLTLRPTLRWLVVATAAGKRRVRTAYQTGGLTWRADYHLVLSEDEKHADLGAWVTLLNQSGASWPRARLKLIAGEVQQVQNNRGGGFALYAGDADASAPGFKEKAFFEYHLYTLPRPTDIVDNSTQQLALFPTVAGVATEKALVYDGQPEDGNWQNEMEPRLDRNYGLHSTHQVNVYVRFANTEANHLGMPLPRGKLRLYKEDPADHALEFIGEDVIDHTPKDETVQVKVGKSFDVVGERTQTDFQVDENAHWIRESFRIALRNHKAEASRITVKENLYRWGTWLIEKKSDAFVKDNARTIHFAVEIPAGGEKAIEYTVKYTW